MSIQAERNTTSPAIQAVTEGRRPCRNPAPVLQASTRRGGSRRPAILSSPRMVANTSGMDPESWQSPTSTRTNDQATFDNSRIEVGMTKPRRKSPPATRPHRLTQLQKAVVTSTIRNLFMATFTILSYQLYCLIELSLSVDTKSFDGDLTALMALSTDYWKMFRLACYWTYLISLFIYLFIPIAWIVSNWIWSKQCYGHLTKLPKSYSSFLDASYYLFVRIIMNGYRFVAAFTNFFFLGAVRDCFILLKWPVKTFVRLYHEARRYTQSLIDGLPAVAYWESFVSWQHTWKGRVILILVWYMVIRIALNARYVDMPEARDGNTLTSSPTTRQTATATAVSWYSPSYTTSSGGQLLYTTSQGGLRRVSTAITVDKLPLKRLYRDGQPDNAASEELFLLAGPQSSTMPSTTHDASSTATPKQLRKTPTAAAADQHTRIKSFAGPSKVESYSHDKSAYTRQDPLMGIDIEEHTLSELAEMSGPLHLVTTGYAKTKLKDHKHAYCSLCRQRHGAEVMVAQKNFMYQWQL